MRTLSAAVSLVSVINLFAAPISGAQQLRQSRAGIGPDLSSELRHNPPSDLRLTLVTLGGGVSGAFLTATVGFMIDDRYCERHHGKEPGFIFGPCTFYTGAGTPAGWFSGAVWGSTLKAIHIAEERGCPRQKALIRAAGAALLGTLPGVALVAALPDEYHSSRGFFIGGAPIFAGLAAAAAVAGCHS
jgi:hypothetical protein